ncbi:MAG: UDP-3-O-acyl-N-acetylglucosamine deacetylase [Bacteroidales bacterium]|nr:UDP-3-O-acyl-N-acetylglucosamine deacetylase [Bacteroidales bacterium]
MQLQTTLENTVTLAGPGLHTGKMVEVTLKPAQANTGILFRRTDLNPIVDIPALTSSVGETSRSTAITRDNATVCTIEHLMSALHGLSVDNVIAEINGPEVPILDGSARPWVEAIKKAGKAELDAPRSFVVVTEKVEMAEGSSRYLAEPADDFMVRCIVDFPSPAIGHQEAAFTTGDNYIEQVAPCRTFVFLHEIEPLLANNLIKGGALDNALVFVDHPLAPEQAERLGKVYGKDPNSFQVKNGVLNTVQPYFPNEPARHKLLDFIGDILLVGAPLKGHFTIECPGHKNNVAFAQKVIDSLKK